MRHLMKEILLTLNPTILHASSLAPPTVDPLHPPINPDGVLDLETYQSIEASGLHPLLNRTRTLAGSAILLRSIANPLNDPALLEAKQASLKALQQDARLRQQLESWVSTLAVTEQKFHQLLYGTFLGLVGSKAQPLEVEGYGYDAFIKGSLFLTQAADGAAAFKPSGHRYLDALLESIGDFRHSRAYRLAKGPVYRTEKGIIPKDERRLLTPSIPFNPSLFKPFGIAIFLAFLFLIGEFVPLLLDLVANLAGAFWIFLFPLAFLYIPIIGGFDRDGCIYPYREILRKSGEVHRLVDQIGLVDELLSLVQFGEQTISHSLCIPQIEVHPRHEMQLTNVRNPILAAHNPDYVGNDIDLRAARLTLITGPNSGGKTAFCKTLAQTQVLAQIGSFVFADEAKLTVADRIFHQAPKISQLEDGEGRFGTELLRTKAIFLAATSKSLVIMDELSEGTTHEEKIEISQNILDGFSQKGGSTLLITHNHALVEHYADRKDAQCRQVEFSGHQATYKLIPGISKVSHADQVAARIGFSKVDIARYLGQEKQDPE